MIQGRGKMPAKDRGKITKRIPANDGKLPQRPEGWEDRLRLVGDAQFVAVQWSGRDHPCWPLPTKTQDDR
jgi:hypothetical protein